MAFTDNPNSITDRIRLVVGDTDPTYPFISDDWYTYYIDMGYSESAVALTIAQRILAQYAHSGYREMEGLVHVYGKERFDSYLTWLQEYVRTGGGITPMPYAGGISKADMINNDANPDNVRPFRRYNYEDYL